ncbi:MAG: mannose-1-phosphate guanylyltransferase [Lachnospiraceae bacterium]|jgi:mannose-1-phosphate guanylyltransferase|nr:mannose-1-phosphate guanylyltransferase [Lachnospiraceae bacterium]
MNIYGLIMAGGGGTRFWPLSRKKKPKQMLNLDGKDTMINKTIDRVAKALPGENIFIVTNKDQARDMESIVMDKVEISHILKEPAARNTAACIGYGAMEIVKKYGDGMMCIFPADHFIKDEHSFAKTVMEGIEQATREDGLVTIGIKPTFPSTGYGYIRYKKEKEEGLAYRVEQFVEKPERELAKEYVGSGCYLWNSGMFIWKASVILDYFKELLPKVYTCLLKIGEAMGTEREWEVIEEIYPSIPKISIDYGIMERADKVFVLEGDFGWSDVGSWEALDTLYEPDENNNIIHGDFICIDTNHCISYSSGKLIAAIGLEDIVIVETKDAVLVCKKDRTQDVKEVVEALKKDREDLL